jgi:hypothetical protein
LPLTLALLVACATPYQRNSFTGGYTETQLDKNVFRISFRGNGFTNMDKAVDLALLRSAELTLAHGYKYFSIIDGNNYITSSQVTSPKHSYTNFSVTSYGNTAYGSATTHTYGGQTFNISKPSSSNTFVCFKNKPTDGFSYSAEFIYKNLSQKYGHQTSPLPSNVAQNAVKDSIISPQKVKVFIFAHGSQIREELNGGQANRTQELLDMLAIQDIDKETATDVLRKLANQNVDDIIFAEKVIGFYEL